MSRMLMMFNIETMGPSLLVLYIFFSLNGIYFGNLKCFKTADQNDQQHRRKSTDGRQIQVRRPKMSRWYWIRFPVLLFHLALLTKAVLHLGVVLFDTRPQLQGLHYKPITRFLFRFYKTIYLLDRVRFYVSFLLMGEKCIRLLSHPLYRKADQSLAITKRTVVVLLLYNTILAVIFFSVINHDRTLNPDVLLSFFEFIEMINHSPLIDILTFYIVLISRLYFQGLIDWIQTNQQQITVEQVVQFKPIIYRLVANVDRFYTMSSLAMLCKQIVGILSMISAFLYIPLSDDGHEPFVERLLVFDLFEILIFEMAYLHITGLLLETYDQLYLAIMNHCVLKCSERQQQQHRPTTDRYRYWDQRTNSSKIELVQLKHYREKLMPRLFQITFLKHSIHLKTILFCVNFAIILFQTEKTD